jgi:hypothetical protein
MDTANIDIKVLEGMIPKATGPSLSQEEQQKFMLNKYKKLMKGALCNGTIK